MPLSKHITQTIQEVLNPKVGAMFWSDVMKMVGLDVKKKKIIKGKEESYCTQSDMTSLLWKDM